jgi:hypothetical protein
MLVSDAQNDESAGGSFTSPEVLCISDAFFWLAHFLIVRCDQRVR